MHVFNQQIISQCIIRHASSGKAMNRFVKMLMDCDANFLGISNSRFSYILGCKSAINVRVAKAMHTKLGFNT